MLLCPHMPHTLALDEVVKTWPEPKGGRGYGRRSRQDHGAKGSCSGAGRDASWQDDARGQPDPGLVRQHDGPKPRPNPHNKPRSNRNGDGNRCKLRSKPWQRGLTAWRLTKPASGFAAPLPLAGEVDALERARRVGEGLSTRGSALPLSRQLKLISSPSNGADLDIG